MSDDTDTGDPKDRSSYEPDSGRCGLISGIGESGKGDLSSLTEVIDTGDSGLCSEAKVRTVHGSFSSASEVSESGDKGDNLYCVSEYSKSDTSNWGIGESGDNCRCSLMETFDSGEEGLPTKSNAEGATSSHSHSDSVDSGVPDLSPSTALMNSCTVTAK